MKYLFLFLFILSGACATVSAQETTHSSTDRRIVYKSPLDEDLAKQTFEVEYFAKHLDMLKTAFAAKDPSKVVANESVLLNAMRIEIQQTEDKVDSEKIQAERRKNASSGTPNAARPSERPKRDPLADAVTPAEQHLESMRTIMGAFQRHAFDVSKPADASRDFAKLDEFLKIMQEELLALKTIQEGRH